MTIEKFITDVAEAIETEQNGLLAGTEYKELNNWDSMAALSMIAMIDDVYNVSVGGDDLEKTNTVKELWELVAKRMS